MEVHRIGDPEVPRDIVRREDIDADYSLFPEWENDWSGWVLIMKHNSQNDSNFHTRGPGFYKKQKALKQELKDAIPSRRIPRCGIYELKADDTVVYVGYKGAGNKKEPDMFARIMFCTKIKFHRKKLIDDTFKQGCDIWVRIKESRNAKGDKTKILLKYDFPWNERKPARTVLEQKTTE